MTPRPTVQPTQRLAPTRSEQAGAWQQMRASGSGHQMRAGGSHTQQSR